MKKTHIGFLFVISMLLGACGTGGTSTSTTTAQQKIQKLSVDDSQVKTTYYVGEAFTLEHLVVKVLTFENHAWNEGVEVTDYQSSIEVGTVFQQEETKKVTISYLDFIPHTFSIEIIDNSQYKTNEDFHFASTKVGENNLNTAVFGKNAGSTAYLDPLGKTNRILVVPYYFTDQKDMATEENRLKIEKTFFGTKEEALTNDQPYSVKSYYETSSFSQTVFEGDVIPWFPSKVGSSDQLKNGGYEAAEDIYNRYTSEYEKENHGILGKDAHPWEYYDGNHDGMIDLLWIVYSKDRVEGGTNQWWAYTSHDGSSYNPNLYRPVVKTFCWASFSFMWGGYDPHTYVHETGHAYGLDDYYDYNAHWALMGKIDMMDSNIGEHNAFSKFALGWASPLVVDDSAIIDLKPYAESGESILLPSPNYNGTSFDEYLILQYDTPTGLNERDYYSNSSAVTGYTKPGLRILHVDARTYANSKKEPLTDANAIYNTAVDWINDNSHFGRGSNNNPMNAKNEYWEGNYNASHQDRSYSLVNVIPASYQPDNNTMNSTMTLNNSALFQKGTTFSLDESWYEFMPSYRNLWNKARSYDENGNVQIDDTMKVNYQVSIISMDENSMKVRIYKGE